VPWVPELFSAPVVARLEEQRRRTLQSVPFFEGLRTGELDALLGSFAGEPELHHPVRGRIRGAHAFSTFVSEMNAWLDSRRVSVEQIEQVPIAGRGFDETVLHLDGDSGRVQLPVATVADKRADDRLQELRMYFSSWPLTGRHSNRPPVLQPDPELHHFDVVAEYQSALAAGDADRIVALFEPGGYAREPAGGEYTHVGPDALRAFYASLFSNDGGIPLEHCTLMDDGRVCALEYNVVRWGRTELTPQAGLAVYVRGQRGKLAAARIYDDVDPPL
jgi:SnoaL-like domain